jgi:NAD(P)-dependent dehydrogenase (short-subunit alcohol dehydrogenase family)
MADQTEENFDRIFSVNLRGVFLCPRAEISELLKSGGGAIVNLSSVVGRSDFPVSRPMWRPSTGSMV